MAIVFRRVGLAEPVVVLQSFARLGRLGGGGEETVGVVAAALAILQGVDVLLLLARRPHADVHELGFVLKGAGHDPKYVAPPLAFKD